MRADMCWLRRREVVAGCLLLAAQLILEEALEASVSLSFLGALLCFTPLFLAFVAIVHPLAMAAHGSRPAVDLRLGLSH